MRLGSGANAIVFPHISVELFQGKTTEEGGLFAWARERGKGEVLCECCSRTDLDRGNFREGSDAFCVFPGSGGGCDSYCPCRAAAADCCLLSKEKKAKGKNAISNLMPGDGRKSQSVSPGGVCKTLEYGEEGCVAESLSLLSLTFGRSASVKRKKYCRRLAKTCVRLCGVQRKEKEKGGQH